MEPAAQERHELDSRLVKSVHDITNCPNLAVFSWVGGLLRSRKVAELRQQIKVNTRPLNGATGGIPYPQRAVEQQTYAQRLAERTSAMQEIALGMCGFNRLAIMDEIARLRTLVRDMERNHG